MLICCTEALDSHDSCHSCQIKETLAHVCNQFQKLHCYSMHQRACCTCVFKRTCIDLAHRSSNFSQYEAHVNLIMHGSSWSSWWLPLVSNARNFCTCIAKFSELLLVFAQRNVMTNVCSFLVTQFWFSEFYKKKEFRVLLIQIKKGATQGAQRIFTSCTYFYENIPVNGLEYTRWVDLKLSVGLFIFPLRYKSHLSGSFCAPFFSCGACQEVPLFLSLASLAG